MVLKSGGIRCKYCNEGIYIPSMGGNLRDIVKRHEDKCPDNPHKEGRSMRYNLKEENPPYVASIQTDMKTVSYRTWPGWDNIAIGNRGKKVPDTIYIDFTSSNVYTSWAALDKFWEELAQITIPRSEYIGFTGSGVNGGAELICRFFAEHEKYKCHIEQQNDRTVLVKAVSA